MDILEKIIATKLREVELRKKENGYGVLEKDPLFKRTAYSLVANLNHDNSSQIIAEYKRKSPSKGIINDTSMVSEVTLGYQKAGCAGISILTDKPFFGGSPDDIRTVREQLTVPILRKDFIIDPYQLVEAKAMGADVVLLIAEALTQKQVTSLAQEAKNLGLEVLLEMHSREQLEKINADIDLVGINNRDLKTFVVDLNTSLSLAQEIPPQFVKISESGISNVDSLLQLLGAGFKGFLIGENFMTNNSPGKACNKFIAELRALKHLW